MPRPKLNVDWQIGAKKCKVRKRGCSSSSSSSMAQNSRLKRAFLVGKRRGGSSTPVPMWKMMSSSPPSLDKDKALKCVSASRSSEKVKELSVSARKLAATLWEINGLPSPKVKNDDSEDKMSEIEGVLRKESVSEEFKAGSMAICVSDLVHCPVSEKMDKPKVGSHRRRLSASSQKYLQADLDLKCAKSPHHSLVEVDHSKLDSRSPCKHVSGGTKNRLKDVYNSLITSKELLKVMNRVCHFEELNSTSLSLVSALKFELDRACIQVSKLIQEQRANSNEIDVLLKLFEEEKLVWKIKERERIHSAVTSISRELEKEKKMRRQTERLNAKLGKELSETKLRLSEAMKEVESEKRAREILGQMCDELARGIGEDRAEVEELKKQSEKVREEVEKEREMLQMADILREERVQMKLSEAKYHFEEKNAIVDKLRNELETYLKSKKRQERGDDSPSYEKIRELEMYLRKTLPGSEQNQEKEENNAKEEYAKADENDDDDDSDCSDDSDLHSIELNVDDISKKFLWGGGLKNESKRNSVDKTKGRKSVSDKTKKPTIAENIGSQFTTGKTEDLEAFDRRGLFEFSSQHWKNGIEDEIERYNMIKNLRDHIVSGSKLGLSSASSSSSQELASPNQKISLQNGVSSKDHDGVSFQR